MLKRYFEITSEKLLRQSLLMTPARIKSIRRIYNLTQVTFAQVLNVSFHTYKNWEIGHRHPCTAAVALLMLAEKNPKLFLKKQLKSHLDQLVAEMEK